MLKSSSTLPSSSGTEKGTRGGDREASDDGGEKGRGDPVAEESDDQCERSAEERVIEEATLVDVRMGKSNPRPIGGSGRRGVHGGVV